MHYFLPDRGSEKSVVFLGSNTQSPLPANNPPVFHAAKKTKAINKDLLCLSQEKAKKQITDGLWLPSQMPFI
jgi:hypothetical protein